MALAETECRGLSFPLDLLGCESEAAVLAAAGIVLPTPVLDMTVEEFHQIIDAVTWNRAAWTLPTTHVYAVGRARHQQPDRRRARIYFRNKRQQLAVLLMLAFRKPSLHETTVRLKRGCADRCCVNPFHFTLDAKRMEKRRKTILEGAVPGSLVDRRLNTQSWARIGSEAMVELSCGDETSSHRSSPFHNAFSALASELSDEEDE